MLFMVAGTTAAAASFLTALARPREDKGKALTLAAAAGDTHAITVLVEQEGVSPDARDMEAGLSPLSAAAMYGNLSCARRLLELGASPRTPDADGALPVHHAAERGHQ